MIVEFVFIMKITKQRYLGYEILIFNLLKYNKYSWLRIGFFYIKKYTYHHSFYKLLFLFIR